MLFRSRIWNQQGDLFHTVAHSEEVPIPVFTTLPDLPLSDVEDNQNLQSSTIDSSGSEYEESISTPEQFSKEELNDLIKDRSVHQSKQLNF